MGTGGADASGSGTGGSNAGDANIGEPNTDADAGDTGTPTGDADAGNAAAGNGNSGNANAGSAGAGDANVRTCREVQVPAMTSATTPSGEVTRSGAYDSSYEAWQAFDASATTLWISETSQTPAWIAYQWADSPKRMVRYALTFKNGADLATRAPKEFALEGWDGQNWVSVDVRHDQTNWLGSERREYVVSNLHSYLKYRLNFSDDNDDRSGVVVISLGRIEFVAVECSSAGGN